ncbi:MAG: hypothetical protein IKI97_12420 [Clostridia bacterium]|nr:hypothetical protein [Clostridia bacterium]
MVRKTHLSKLFAIVLITVISAFSLYSCKGSKKQQAVSGLSDILRGNYESEISFFVPGTDAEYNGKAKIIRDGTITRLDILSPEPYSGMSIEYDVKGLPSSVAVHFSGIDIELPAKALSRVNSVAVLFADDFTSALGKIHPESITEYSLPDETSGYCVTLPYSDAEITIYFSDESYIPYSLEYRGKEINADIVFDSFKPEITSVE